MTPNELAGNVLWYFGAKFLQLPESSWPVLKPGDNFINKQADGELKFIDNSHKQAEGELKFIDNSSLVSISDYNFSVNDNSFILEIIQIDKLIRVTALVITFIAILRQKKEERMVGSTKRLLFTSTVTFNELLTLLHETEVVITPNHLIYGRNIINHIAKRVQHEELTDVNADIHFNYVTDLLTRFWK